MTRRLKVGVSLAAALGLAVTAFAGSRLERSEAERIASPRELLYLPNGSALRVASLGFAPLVADAFYVWAIQYYSDYQRPQRYRWVEHVFDRVITELDPHYIDAYWIGAMILILEAGQPEPGLRLLEKGAARNPDAWVLLYLAGWESYHAGQADRAQEYFRRAMQVPGAPSVLPRIVAGIEAREGNLQEAIQLWRQVLEDPASDERGRDVAERQIRELTVRADLQVLEQAVLRFRADAGRLPRALDELVTRGYLRGEPLDPSGHRYDYDPSTGAVRQPRRQVLGPS